MIFSDFDKKMMSLAIEQALISKSKDEVPIGSVLTKKETILSKGHNLSIEMNDPTAHAEILAIRSACEKEKNYRIIDSTVKYIILSSSAYSRYFHSDGTLKDSSKKQGLLYLNFFERNKLVKEFKPDYKKTTGPVLRIYINNIYKE